MNTQGSREYLFGRDTMVKLAILLLASTLAWALGAPTILNRTEAANVSNFSDTISNSAPAVLASSTLVFTLQNTITTSGSPTLSITLDPSGSAFAQSFSAATSSQIYVSAGGTDYDVVTSCTAGNQVTVTANYNTGSNENITFTFCSAGSNISTSTTVTIGVGPLWTNPSTSGASYVIRLGGTSLVTGDTRVAIVDNVRVTASVDTSFTFTVTGVATSTQLSGTGTTTTRSSTPTAMFFGTLVPHQPQVLAQQLSVSTNANNGFVVTVIEDQDPTSGTGATIKLFRDGSRTGTPAVWASPSNTLNATSTWAHFGLTSDDQDLNGGEFAFSGSRFVGNFFSTSTPRQVFAHYGPSDGSTQNVGTAMVGYAMEVGSLQPAGTDYTNTLTYVATPTF